MPVWHGVFALLRYPMAHATRHATETPRPRAFLACVLVINTTLILAIDMYVPALPGLLHEFDTTASFLNLTMFMFMFVSAFAILVSGPLSDKFGRKPVLVASCAIFAVSSFGCALSTSVLMLTTFRIGQAVGFGLVETDVTALIKDAYADKDLKFAMSLLQSLVIIGPVLAPFLGTLLLSIGGWREIFIALAVMGSVDLVFAFLITETLQPSQRLASGVIRPCAIRFPVGAAAFEAHVLRHGAHRRPGRTALHGLYRRGLVHSARRFWRELPRLQPRVCRHLHRERACPLCLPAPIQGDETQAPHFALHRARFGGRCAHPGSSGHGGRLPSSSFSRPTLSWRASFVRTPSLSCLTSHPSR